MTPEKILKQKFAAILPILDEKQQRLVAAAEAKALGYGGVSQVAAASGIARTRIHRGLEELDRPLEDRIRAEGGGRKRTHRDDKKLVTAIKKMVEDTTRGDPMSPLRWTCKGTRDIADALAEKGLKASHATVGRILKEKLKYSLQANEKSIASKQHPDRNDQFEYINSQVKLFLRNKWPVISVDAKKKENIGNFANKGREWRPEGVPRPVRDHDFADEEGEIAIPFGVLDLGKNMGWVNVGKDHNTAAFAVNSIHGWWKYMGAELHPKATGLLICADGGGSNAITSRLWKADLQNFANATQLAVTVCHLPPGTSKWNKIEHRLFSFISMQWKGKLLTSYDVVVKLIGATKTRTGLKVTAKIDPRPYPLGVYVSDEEMNQLQIVPHKFHGEWNYTISPIKKCKL